MLSRELLPASLAIFSTAALASFESLGVAAALLFGSAPFMVFSTLRFQLDLPLAAMVAVALVVLLATDRFTRTPAALAFGLVCGLGMLTKPTFALYIVVPVLVAHGSRDGLIPPALGRALYERARAPKKFMLVEGGTHYSTNAMGQPQYRQALQELFGLRL